MNFLSKFLMETNWTPFFTINFFTIEYALEYKKTNFIPSKKKKICGELVIKIVLKIKYNREKILTI